MAEKPTLLAGRRAVLRQIEPQWTGTYIQSKPKGLRTMTTAVGSGRFGLNAASISGYPDTFYSRSLADGRLRPALSGYLETHTAVVGGGLAGLTVALELARAGLSVVVLEAKRVGFGASGRNGGFVTPGYSLGADKIAVMVGEKAAEELHELSLEGMNFVKDTIDSLGIESADLRRGLLRVVRHDGREKLRALADRALRSGRDMRFVDIEELRGSLKSRRYFQAVRDAEAMHIHPLNYLRAITTEIERLGGSIFEMSEVMDVQLDGPSKMLGTEQGRVRAENVVFASGGYTGLLVRKLHRSFLPIATYVMLTEPASGLIANAIATSDAVIDNRKAGDYYRLVNNGQRILWGGRITARAASAEGVARELRREMVGTFPQLENLRTELAWSGLLSYARHQMPQIGQLREGVWYCTAFGGHGLNTTAIGGRVVAEAIVGTSDRYRHFAPFGLNWTGGLVGRAAAQLTYWKLQAEDRWRERRSTADEDARLRRVEH